MQSFNTVGNIGRYDKALASATDLFRLIDRSLNCSIQNESGGKDGDMIVYGI